MILSKRAQWVASLVTMASVLSAAAPVLAQSHPSTEPPARALDTAHALDTAEALASSPRSPWKSLFTDTVRDFRDLPSRNSLEWLTLGAVAAFGAHFKDSDISRSWSSSDELRGSARPGAVLGSTPFQLGAAAATFTIGHLANKPRVAHVGADLIRAQFMAEAMTIGIKQSVRRNRPEGSGFSFPSGHTTVSFASATVLQHHFGWKVGAPAYAVAGYVALSRVQMRRHYLSDVAFGAALGIVAGRTITLGHEGHGLQVEPVATPGGAAVSFTWKGRWS